VTKSILIPSGTGIGSGGASSVGPAGPTGPIGPAGPKGDQGDPGADSTVPGPASTVPGPPGPQGDPGADSTVPGPQGVKGDKGDPGDDSVVPGPQGDPGADSTVPGPQGVPGPKGDQGDPGADSTVPGPEGAQGVKGDPGDPGADSTVPGPQGVQGVKGDKGDPGADSTVAGPPGADSTVPGPKGDQGDPGADSTVPGPKGDQGDPGPIGLTGPTGADSTVPGPKGDTGDTGPTGATGPASTVPGPQGLPGTQGIAGPAGNTVLSDSGAPSNVVGVDGDWYIQTGAWRLFGPKTGGSWPGTSTSLVGPAGANGTDGMTVLSGTVPPTGSNGKAGDFWIDTTAWMIYGPKTATWPAGTSLVGPAGPAGSGGGANLVTTQNTTSTTAMSATPALTVAQVNGTTNNWSELEFKSTGPVTAGIVAKNLNHTSGYGELWTYGRSPAGLYPRLRLPQTGGMEVYGDAGTVVSSTTNTGSVRASSLQTTATPGPGPGLTNNAFTTDLSGWVAGAGWSWSAGTALHTAGSVGTLSQTLSGMTPGTLVKISWTVIGRTAGSFVPDLGGVAGSAAAFTDSCYLPVSSATPVLTFTPASSFNGAFDNVTVQPLIPSVPQVFLDGAPGTSLAQIRAAGDSVGMGQGALANTQTGSANVACGYNALGNLTDGTYNAAVGYAALSAAMSTYATVAVGYNALKALSSSGNLVAVGAYALENHTGFGAPVAVGSQALRLQTAGTNTAIGYLAGNPGASGTNATTTGTHQTLLGEQTGQSSAVVANDLVCVGYLAVGTTNSTAIGSGTSASGLGAVAIGKDSGGTSATSAVDNQFVLGTANHTVLVPGTTRLGTSATSKIGLWGATAVVQNTGWSVTAGYTADKTFNPATTTLAEVANVLGTLIDTLKTYGVLG
jgi:hypothetical protein